MWVGLNAAICKWVAYFLQLLFSFRFSWVFSLSEVEFPDFCENVHLHYKWAEVEAAVEVEVEVGVEVRKITIRKSVLYKNLKFKKSTNQPFLKFPNLGKFHLRNFWRSEKFKISTSSKVSIFVFFSERRRRSPSPDRRRDRDYDRDRDRDRRDDRRERDKRSSLKSNFKSGIDGFFFFKLWK